MAEDKLKYRYTRQIKECIVNLYNYEKLSAKSETQADTGIGKNHILIICPENVKNACNFSLHMIN